MRGWSQVSTRGISLWSLPLFAFKKNHNYTRKVTGMLLTVVKKDIIIERHQNCYRHLTIDRGVTTTILWWLII